ncbi:MAG TPA: 50S ribosomal protein L4 [Spirochaetia bacterium]|nr:50S ribosomal protein L4 [Spirochaetia bacterium]
MLHSVFNVEGKEIEKINLDSVVFNTDVNTNSIYETVKNQLANRRQGTHSVKNITAVHGTTRKPWRQKGTGRARAGMNKSALWVGGAITFGPQPRDYSYVIPKKIKQQAIFSVFSDFLKNNKLKVIEDFTLTEYKTKKLSAIFSSFSASKKVVFIISSHGNSSYEKIIKSAGNIPWLKTYNVDAISLPELFYAHEVILTKSAAEILNSRYSGKTAEVKK